MFSKTQTFGGLLALALSTAAAAANKPADGCQIFIKKVAATAGSHSSGSIATVVKVGWIGNGEQIERVGFYHYQRAEAQGDMSHCSWSPSYNNGNWHIEDLTPGGYYATEYGEYSMSFPVYSGSVSSDCLGYHYAHIGTFFVQTNKNTYWLNPDMNADKYFYFDDNGFDNLVKVSSYFNYVNTADHDYTRYYNPLVCR